MATDSSNALGVDIQTAEIDDNAITLAKLAHGTANKLIGFDGSGVPAEIGSSSVPIIALYGCTFDSVIAGTWTISESSSYYFGQVLAQSSGAINNGVKWKAYFSSGTYTIRIMAQVTNASGIAHISVDGNEVATIDLYNGSGSMQILEDASIAITADGYVDIDVEMKSKNGSSSNYLSYISAIIFEKTA